MDIVSKIRKGVEDFDNWNLYHLEDVEGADPSVGIMADGYIGGFLKWISIRLEEKDIMKNIGDIFKSLRGEDFRYTVEKNQLHSGIIHSVESMEKYGDLIGEDIEEYLEGDFEILDHSVVDVDFPETDEEAEAVYMRVKVLFW